MASTSSNGNLKEGRFLRKNMVNVVNKGEAQKMTRQALNQILNETYGTGRTNSEKDFLDTLEQYGDWSLHLLVVYVFTVWICSTCMFTLYLTMENPITVRCRIPALEKCFNFFQILNISVKNKEPTFQSTGSKQYCDYDVRDYDSLIKLFGCNYSAIMMATDSSRAEEKRSCEEHVVYAEKCFAAMNCNRNPTAYHRWYCSRNIWRSVFLQLDKHAECCLTALLIPVADLYGRKRAFIVASSLHAMGYIIMYLPSEWFLLMGIIISSTRHLVVSALYVLNLELCNEELVLRMSVLLSLMYPTTNTMVLLLNYAVKYWFYRQLTVTAMLLVLPFGIWYLPESPRWLMFTGNKSEAWKALMDWERDIQPNADDLHTPTAIKLGFKQQLKFFSRPLFLKRIINCFLLCFLYHISKYESGRVDLAGYAQTHIKFYIAAIVLQIIIVILSNIASIRYGRKRTMFTLYCISAPINAIIFMQTEARSSNWFILLLLRYLLDGITISGYFIVLFYVSEMFPTPYRVTAVNITLTANVLGYIIQYHLYAIFRPQSSGIMYMPIFLSSMACMLIVYFLPETRNDGLPDTPRDALYIPYRNIN